MLKAVSQCHENNIGHRDLKMENFVLNDKFDLKLIDFGIATSLAKEDGSRIFHTEKTGTENYIAPEIWKKLPYDAELVDIFSLGVMLFNLIAGQQPF